MTFNQSGLLVSILKVGITRHLVVLPGLAGPGFHNIWSKGSGQELSRNTALGVESEVPASHSKSATHQPGGSGQQSPSLP